MSTVAKAEQMPTTVFIAFLLLMAVFRGPSTRRPGYSFQECTPSSPRGADPRSHLTTLWTGAVTSTSRWCRLLDDGRSDGRSERACSTRQLSEASLQERVRSVAPPRR